jgi:hypothetical protein
MTLHGAREFRNRLNAIRDTGRIVAESWAEDGANDMRAEIPRVTGETAASLRGEADAGGGRIMGSPVVTYLAGGTAAHEERPVNAQAMRFAVGGRTVFTKRVMHPPTRGNPRILDAARNALTGMAAACYRLWNGAA